MMRRNGKLACNLFQIILDSMVWIHTVQPRVHSCCINLNENTNLYNTDGSYKLINLICYTTVLGSNEGDSSQARTLPTRCVLITVLCIQIWVWETPTDIEVSMSIGTPTQHSHENGSLLISRGFQVYDSDFDSLGISKVIVICNCNHLVQCSPVAPDT